MRECQVEKSEKRAVYVTTYAGIVLAAYVIRTIGARNELPESKPGIDSLLSIVAVLHQYIATQDGMV